VGKGYEAHMDEAGSWAGTGPRVSNLDLEMEDETDVVKFEDDVGE